MGDSPVRHAVIPEAGKLEIRRGERPKLKPGHVLVDVRMCGVCGTDLQIFAGRFPVPLPYAPGHEYVGEVASVGEGVEGLRVGERVAVNPNYHCGVCDACRRGRPNLCLDRRAPGLKSNGGFADCCAVPGSLVHPLPAGLDWREAVLAEPLSCALHAVEAGGIAAGQPVVLIGCGTMGLLGLMLAKRRGARPIIVSDPVARKRVMAAEMGADAVWDPGRGPLADRVRELANGGATVVIDNVGVERTVAEGLSCLATGGTLVLAGIDNQARQLPITPIEVTERELRIQGVFLNPGTFPKALGLLREVGRACAALVTHEFPLEKISEAFAAAGSTDAIKVVVRPD